MLLDQCNYSTMDLIQYQYNQTFPGLAKKKYFGIPVNKFIIK